MLGIEPLESQIRITSKDSAVADGELVLERAALGQVCTVHNAAGVVVGHLSFDAAPATVQGSARQSPCIHLGEQDGTVPCRSCGNKSVQVKVYRCKVHGKCHLGRKAADDVIGCQSCPNYKSV
jgi:hypothetical protein